MRDVQPMPQPRRKRKSISMLYAHWRGCQSRPRISKDLAEKFASLSGRRTAPAVMTQPIIAAQRDSPALAQAVNWSRERSLRPGPKGDRKGNYDHGTPYGTTQRQGPSPSKGRRDISPLPRRSARSPGAASIRTTRVGGPPGAPLSPVRRPGKMTPHPTQKRIIL